VGSAVVIAQIEKLLFWDALYFSFITGFTIGSADIFFQTPFRRLVPSLLGLIRIIFSGLMVAAAIRAVEQGMEDMNKS